MLQDQQKLSPEDAPLNNVATAPADHEAKLSALMAAEWDTVALYNPAVGEIVAQVKEIAEMKMRTEKCQAKRRQSELLPNVHPKRLCKDVSSTNSNVLTLRMRGLNVQWPFSQLLLMGAKTEEVRAYNLGGRVNADEEFWLVETKGKCAKAMKSAMVDDLPIAPRPSDAQIVGTISFADARQYDSRHAFEEARHLHRIAAGSKYDWDGSGAMYGWRVDKVRALVTPQPISTGIFGLTECTHSVAFQTHQQSAESQRIQSAVEPTCSIAGESSMAVAGG